MTREQMIVYMNLLDESFIVEASPANTHKFIVHKKKQIYFVYSEKRRVLVWLYLHITTGLN